MKINVNIKKKLFSTTLINIKPKIKEDKSKKEDKNINFKLMDKKEIKNKSNYKLLDLKNNVNKKIINSVNVKKNNYDFINNFRQKRIIKFHKKKEFLNFKDNTKKDEKLVNNSTKIYSLFNNKVISYFLNKENLNISHLNMSKTKSLIFNKDVNLKKLDFNNLFSYIKLNYFKKMNIKIINDLKKSLIDKLLYNNNYKFIKNKNKNNKYKIDIYLDNLLVIEEIEWYKLIIIIENEMKEINIELSSKDLELFIESQNN